MSLQPSTSSIMDKGGTEATPEEKDANKIESKEVQPTQEPTTADRKRSRKNSKAESSVDGDETNDVVEVWPENSKRVKVDHDLSSSPKGVRSPSPPPVSGPSAGSNGSWSSLPRYIVRCPIKNGTEQFGVKLKLFGKNLRIGCKYADPISASKVAESTKRYLRINDTGNFFLDPSPQVKSHLASLVCKIHDVNYMNMNRLKTKTVLEVLSDFIRVSNAKRLTRRLCALASTVPQNTLEDFIRVTSKAKEQQQQEGPVTQESMPRSCIRSSAMDHVGMSGCDNKLGPGPSPWLMRHAGMPLMENVRAPPAADRATAKIADSHKNGHEACKAAWLRELSQMQMQCMQQRQGMRHRGSDSEAAAEPMFDRKDPTLRSQPSFPRRILDHQSMMQQHAMRSQQQPLKTEQTPMMGRERLMHMRASVPQALSMRQSEMHEHRDNHYRARLSAHEQQLNPSELMRSIRTNQYHHQGHVTDQMRRPAMPARSGPLAFASSLLHSKLLKSFDLNPSAQLEMLMLHRVYIADLRSIYEQVKATQCMLLGAVKASTAGGITRSQQLIMMGLDSLNRLSERTAAVAFEQGPMGLPSSRMGLSSRDAIVSRNSMGAMPPSNRDAINSRGTLVSSRRIREVKWRPPGRLREVKWRPPVERPHDISSDAVAAR